MEINSRKERQRKNQKKTEKEPLALNSRNNLFNKSFSKYNLEYYSSVTKIDKRMMHSANQNRNLQVKLVMLKKMYPAMIKTLWKKYSITKEDYEMMTVENLICNKNCHMVTLFLDYMILDYIEEFLKRMYNSSESVERIQKFTSYYKNYLKFFCNPIFRDFKVNEIIQNYGEKRAEIYYQEHFGNKNKQMNNVNSLCNGNNLNITVKNIFNTTIKDNIDHNSITMTESTLAKEDLPNFIYPVSESILNHKKKDANHFNKNNIMKPLQSQRIHHLRFNSLNFINTCAMSSAIDKAIEKRYDGNDISINLEDSHISNCKKSGLLTKVSIEESLLLILNNLNGKANDKLSLRLSNNIGQNNPCYLQKHKQCAVSSTIEDQGISNFNKYSWITHSQNEHLFAKPTTSSGYITNRKFIKKEEVEIAPYEQKLPQKQPSNTKSRNNQVCRGSLEKMEIKTMIQMKPHKNNLINSNIQLTKPNFSNVSDHSVKTSSISQYKVLFPKNLGNLKYQLNKMKTVGSEQIRKNPSHIKNVYSCENPHRIFISNIPQIQISNSHPKSSSANKLKTGVDDYSIKPSTYNQKDTTSQKGLNCIFINQYPTQFKGGTNTDPYIINRNSNANELMKITLSLGMDNKIGKGRVNSNRNIRMLSNAVSTPSMNIESMNNLNININNQIQINHINNVNLQINNHIAPSCAIEAQLNSKLLANEEVVRNTNVNLKSLIEKNKNLSRNKKYSLYKIPTTATNANEEIEIMNNQNSNNKIFNSYSHQENQKKINTINHKLPNAVNIKQTFKELKVLNSQTDELKHPSRSIYKQAELILRVGNVSGVQKKQKFQKVKCDFTKFHSPTRLFVGQTHPNEIKGKNVSIFQTIAGISQRKYATQK